MEAAALSLYLLMGCCMLIEAEAAHPGPSFDRLSSNAVLERVLEFNHLL